MTEERAERILTWGEKHERSVVERARANGGWCYLSYGSDMSASIRLTETGVGHWEQTHPFVATFVLTSEPAP